MINSFSISNQCQYMKDVTLINLQPNYPTYSHSSHLSGELVLLTP